MQCNNNNQTARQVGARSQEDPLTESPEGAKHPKMQSKLTPLLREDGGVFSPQQQGSTSREFTISRILHGSSNNTQPPARRHFSVKKARQMGQRSLVKLFAGTPLHQAS
ncbi:hypothetical protein AVEN_209976-1 [Araneus ventricosus]|uniref:Uncharacterized protein n=1 Tax=Araneus ventricosus TaxID=182803 RepID=A0A4Y2DBB1_ARAVE|nr:hypothetical protein AVEN_209976-1 [Araneus ventricosus]